MKEEVYPSLKSAILSSIGKVIETVLLILVLSNSRSFKMFIIVLQSLKRLNHSLSDENAFLL